MEISDSDRHTNFRLDRVLLVLVLNFVVKSALKSARLDDFTSKCKEAKQATISVFTPALARPLNRSGTADRASRLFDCRHFDPLLDCPYLVRGATFINEQSIHSHRNNSRRVDAAMRIYFTSHHHSAGYRFIGTNGPSSIPCIT